MRLIPHVRFVRDPPLRLSERVEISKPFDAAVVFREYIAHEDREFFMAAYLTVKHHLIGLKTIAIGSLTASLVHPREVFKPAILVSAAGVVVAHNHPSGDPEPSAEDLALTRRLAAAGSLLGIEILDHIIIGETSHVSLKERGVL